MRFFTMKEKVSNAFLFLKHSMVMTGGLGIRMIAQALLFLVGARVLGAEQFGLFAGVQALLLLAAPFANWGSGYILIKHVARNSRSFALQWGTSLSITAVLGTGVLAFVGVVISLLYSPRAALRVGLPLGIGEIVGQSLVMISSQAFQANENFKATSFVWAGFSLARLLFVSVLFFIPSRVNVSLWAAFYGAGGMVAGLLASGWVSYRYTRPVLGFEGMHEEWGQGFAFALNNAAQGAHNHIDKTLLSQLISNAITGVYSVSYRILDAGFIPVQGLIFAITPRLFAKGGKGIQTARRWGIRFLPWAIGWGVIAWIGAWAASPWLVRLLGKDYALIPAMIQILGGIILLRSIHAIAAAILAGADYQPWRSTAQIVVALLNLGLNLWMIPRWGWRGAAYSSIITDATFVVVLWGMVVFLERKVAHGVA